MSAKKIKNNIEENIDPNLQARLGKDFVVKNMPALSSLSGANYAEEETRQINSTESVIREESANSHRKIGIIIIGAGLVFIVVAFYLVYRFLISPALNPNANKDLNIIATGSDQIIIEEKENNKEDIVEPIPDNGEVIIEDDLEEDIDNEGNLDSEDKPLTLLAMLDSDGDGLSDATEDFLKTDPLNPDSDGDGYSDKEEILNGYNPSGSGTLSDNLNFSLYANNREAYAILYPRAWVLSIENDKSVLFSAPTPEAEMIQVSYEDTEIAYDSILDWYQNQFGVSDNLSADNLVMSSYGPGIRSADGKYVWFLGDEGMRVFVISYISAGDTMPYNDIFKMMTATFMRL